MRGIILVATLLLFTFGPSEAFAKEKGKGPPPGRAEVGKSRAEDVGETVGKEVIDAVADEVTGETGGAKGRPPGLSKKDKLPPGLEKQGKTPPGWEKGRKEGWEKTPGTNESGLRRLIRGIFKRSKEPAVENPRDTRLNSPR